MLKKLKILLADDEAILRLDLREMLTDAGHEVIAEASNGEDAVKLARELKPEFIIMDVKMPVMDGLTAAKLITAENIAPVLLLTAYSQQDIVEKASEAGVIAYLVKPIREEQLFPAMEEAYRKMQQFSMAKRISLKALAESIIAAAAKKN